MGRKRTLAAHLLVAVDKAQLDERMGQVPGRTIQRALAGINVVLGR